MILLKKILNFLKTVPFKTDKNILIEPIVFPLNRLDRTPTQTLSKMSLNYSLTNESNGTFRLIDKSRKLSSKDVFAEDEDLDDE